MASLVFVGLRPASTGHVTGTGRPVPYKIRRLPSIRHLIVTGGKDGFAGFCRVEARLNLEMMAG